MKKHARKISAILFVIVMIFSMSACGSSADYTGEWTGTVNYNTDTLMDMVAKGLGDSIGMEVDYSESLNMDDFDASMEMVLCLNEDESVEMKIAPEEVEAFYNRFADWMMDNLDPIMTPLLDSAFKEQSLTLDQVMKMLDVSSVKDLLAKTGADLDSLKTEMITSMNEESSSAGITENLLKDGAKWKGTSSGVEITDEDGTELLKYDSKAGTLTASGIDTIDKDNMLAQGEIVFKKAEK